MPGCDRWPTWQPRWRCTCCNPADADHIAERLRTAPELAEAVKADIDALDRVLQHLTTAGVLSHDGLSCYALTARGDARRDDRPDGLRAMWDVEIPRSLLVDSCVADPSIGAWLLSTALSRDRSRRTRPCCLQGHGHKEIATGPIRDTRFVLLDQGLLGASSLIRNPRVRS